jgi:hypothetical protein
MAKRSFCGRFFFSFLFVSSLPLLVLLSITTYPYTLLIHLTTPISSLLSPSPNLPASSSIFLPKHVDTTTIPVLILKQNEIHKETTQHPTPSYHHHFHLHRHRHIPSSPQSSSPSNTGTDVEEAEFQGMLDARTMAVRRKLHRVIGRRGEFGIFGQKREKNVETEGEVGETDVLRPVRNRRWQF